MSSQTPRVFGLMTVRNEVDVVAEVLRSATGWCEQIFVLDNGSDDGTWELVNSLAVEDARIVAWKQDPSTYRRTFRADTFQQFRHLARRGDWWCIVDADEMYIDDPRSFVAGIDERYNTVFSTAFHFYMTDLDLVEYEASPARWLEKPVTERLRYYRSAYSALRLARHDPGMIWKDTVFPDRTQIVAPQRIRLKHFQYRSPEQIATRLAVRAAAPQSTFPHERNLRTSLFTEAGKWSDEPWRERIVAAATLDRDDGNGDYVVREEHIPVLPKYRGRTFALLDTARRRIRRVPAVKAVSQSLSKKVSRA